MRVFVVQNNWMGNLFTSHISCSFDAYECYLRRCECVRGVIYLFATQFEFLHLINTKTFSPFSSFVSFLGSGTERHRSNENFMQNPFFTNGLSESGRCGFMVTKRTEPRLCTHIPNTFNSAAIFGAFRYTTAGLQ